MTTGAAIAHSGPAARAVAQSNDGIGKWLEDLITGNGTSPAHIIVTGILGVVPGVGQAFDARDLVFAIIAISRTPKDIGSWVDLTITVIGCIPAFGDALKVGFKLMKQGHSFGRVLDATSPALRGNVERWVRNINWADIANQAKRILREALDAFIDGLDGWLAQVVMGKQQVQAIIAQLKTIKADAPKMIEEAIAELKKLHARMVNDPLPASTAGGSGRMTRNIDETANAAKQPGKAAPHAREERVRHDKTEETTSSNASKQSTKRETDEKKPQRWDSGVPGEHITDYYVKGRHKNFSKANHSGRLIEHWDNPGKQGIDHLWYNGSDAVKPGIVGETKSTMGIASLGKLLAALPASIRDQVKAGMTDDSLGVDAKRAVTKDEDTLKNGMNKPNSGTGLPRQMTIEWVLHTIQRESGLTNHGQLIKREILKFRDDRIETLPYQRWVFMVFYKQLKLHHDSWKASKQQHRHEIQRPIIEIPDNVFIK